MSQQQKGNTILHQNRLRYLLDNIRLLAPNFFYFKAPKRSQMKVKVIQSGAENFAVTTIMPSYINLESIIK